jgi:hypothetical protein
MRYIIPFLFVLSVSAQTKTTHVIWVMTDGLRTQEVFGGAESALMTKEYHVAEDSGVKENYWRDTPEARRMLLMPFLWSVVAQKGQIYGNRQAGSEAYVTNGFNVSYPGYNETLTGAADPRINGNIKLKNPNVTVLEWLNQKTSFHGQVAAFTAWDLFPLILNAERAGFPVNAGYDPFNGLPGNAQIQLINDLKAESPRDWKEEPFDNLTFRTAFEYLKQRKPRVMYLSLGETDEWAHDGKYAEYLRSARRVDEYLRLLWDTAQSIPEYRGSTTMVISVDHGRGEGPEWRQHGKGTPDSKYMWMAFLGPDTPALGERRKIPAVTQSQLAATVAALLGEDYNAFSRQAGAPIRDVLKSH